MQYEGVCVIGATADWPILSPSGIGPGSEMRLLLGVYLHKYVCFCFEHDMLLMSVLVTLSCFIIV